MHWPPTADDFTRLLDSLRWVHEHSPYYRRVFADAGVRVETLHATTSSAAASHAPKTDLVANQRAHPPFGDFLAVPRPVRLAAHVARTDPDPAPARPSAAARRC